MISMLELPRAPWKLVRLSNIMIFFLKQRKINPLIVTKNSFTLVRLICLVDFRSLNGYDNEKKLIISH